MTIETSAPADSCLERRASDSINPELAKRKGEFSELLFILKAISLGFPVSKPFGDSEPYDFIVESSGRLTCIQVKSVYTSTRHSYSIGALHNRNTTEYTPGEVDFIAAYVAPTRLGTSFPSTRSLAIVTFVSTLPAPPEEAAQILNNIAKPETFSVPVSTHPDPTMATGHPRYRAKFTRYRGQPFANPPALKQRPSPDSLYRAKQTDLATTINVSLPRNLPRAGRVPGARSMRSLLKATFREK
jgi:PD-(D/E)XK endonuclease